MKALFCSPIPTVDMRLGASRAVMDLAEAWRDNGWDCDVYSAEGKNVSFAEYPAHLAEYLKEHATDYDVVDFPYHCVPWIEKRHSRTLTVARVVLLAEHCYFEKDPQPSISLKSRIVSLLRARSRARNEEASMLSLQHQKANVLQSNLTSVGNSRDKQCLLRLGFSESKIITVPFGISDAHKKGLFQCSPLPGNTQAPSIVFIGTFDYRKGCLDWRDVITLVSESFPQVRLKLIGTRGMCQSADEVYRFFPKSMHKRITVTPQFAPEMLPGLLDGCSIGVFPSYREGFGIGVVEMLAAGLPVVAYDAPGPCDILPKDWLVPRGDRISLSNKIISLLSETQQSRLTQQARLVAEQFIWSKVARQTYDCYEEALSKLR